MNFPCAFVAAHSFTYSAKCFVSNGYYMSVAYFGHKRLCQCVHIHVFLGPSSWPRMFLVVVKQYAI